MKFLEKIISIKFALLIAVFMILYSLIYKNDFNYYNNIKTNIKELEIEIANLKNENTKLSEQILDLKNNKRILEIKARTELGLVKEDEIIYEIVE